MDPALKLCVHDKIRQVLRTPVNIELGKKLFQNKELELAPFEPVTISGWSNWEQDPHESHFSFALLLCHPEHIFGRSGTFPVLFPWVAADELYPQSWIVENADEAAQKNPQPQPSARNGSQREIRVSMADDFRKHEQATI